MKRFIHRCFPLLLSGIASLCSIPAGAQMLTTLHNVYGGPGTDLIVSDNTLYGINTSGPASGFLFRLGSDGTGHVTLHYFAVGNVARDVLTNSDGLWPTHLLLNSQSLFGVASEGGALGGGTLFKMNTDGTDFTTLHTFSVTDGSPYCLVAAGDVLYGTTMGAPGETISYPVHFNGGSSGTVFTMNADGTGFTVLYSFTSTATPDLRLSDTNQDGAFPSALILAGDILYGTAIYGGESGNGTVFRMNTDGTGFTNLHIFSAFEGYLLGFPTNSDGAHPNGGLCLSGSTLYGTAAVGGWYDQGTVFKLNTDGTGFAVLHSFTSLPNPEFEGSGNTNQDGAVPGGLIIFSNRLFGATLRGGSAAAGTAYTLTTDGREFQSFYSFSGLNNAGANPGAFVLSSDTLYGMTGGGGVFGDGVVFSLSLLPRLEVTRSEPNLVVSWPTNYAGFDYSGFTLQSTTNLTVWTTNLPAPVVLNGQFTVTNPVSGAQRFFRLSQ